MLNMNGHQAALFISPVENLILAALQASEATRMALALRFDTWHPYGTKPSKEVLQAALRRLETMGLISSGREDGQKVYRIEPSGIDAAEAFRNYLFN